MEVTEVVLVHCNIVNNDYQQNSIVSHAFFCNTPFGSLLEIAPTNFILLKNIWFRISRNRSTVYRPK